MRGKARNSSGEKRKRSNNGDVMSTSLSEGCDSGVFVRHTGSPMAGRLAEARRQRR